jgi:hypothetical protein
MAVKKTSWPEKKKTYKKNWAKKTPQKKNAAPKKATKRTVRKPSKPGRLSAAAGAVSGFVKNAMDTVSEKFSGNRGNDTSLNNTHQERERDTSNTMDQSYSRDEEE